jgi:hypothetical protein
MNHRRLIGFALASVLLLGGCANHPMDCAVGFHHADCLPGTAGYDNPDKFSAADDKQCRSYGLVPGTSDYANCRVKLATQHDKGLVS